jgi:superfamily II DNA or RNA helicase
MNPHCNETAIRKAADWRAFKQGSDLLSAVSAAEATETGWRGTVRDGPRPLKVVVIARSPTDMEARCPCRENQATGAFCRHAVAVGLTLALEKSRGPAPAPVAVAAPTPVAPAYVVEFPPPWRRLLENGRLAVKITAADHLPDPHDAKLAAWLGDRRAGGMVQLEGAALAGLLVALAGHPRVRCEKQALSIQSGARLRVGSVTRKAGAVVIEPGEIRAIALGPRLVQFEGDDITLFTERLPAQFAKLGAGQPLHLPLAAFLEHVASLGDALEWPPDGWADSLRFLAAPYQIEITIDAGSHDLTAKPVVRYAGEEPVTPGGGSLRSLPAFEGEETIRVRDHEAEMVVVSTLENFRFKRLDTDASVWRLQGDEAIADFLSEALPALESQYTIQRGPGLVRRWRELAVVTPRFEVLGSGEDWLSFDLSFQAGDSKSPIDPAQVWRLLKSDDAKRKRLPKMLTEVIEPLFGDLNLAQENGRFMVKGASVECVRKILENQDKSLTENLLSYPEYPVPSTIKAELRPYQRAGFSWLIERLNMSGGALLADDMGLGKTIQSIASIECLFEKDASNERSVLVIATTSLLGNWVAEMGKFAPSRKVRVLHGGRREAQKAQAGGGEVWLTSYATLARDLAWYLRQDFLAVVVDEASLMRNPATDHAKAIHKLHAANRIALTGTPIENGVRDLWSIFRFIQPGWLGGRREFMERYESAAAGGDPWALRRLRIKTAPFLLRRTKQEVAPELPSKLLIDEWCDPSAEQQAMLRDLLVAGRRAVEHLEDARHRGAARMQLLTTLLRMRQACCDLALLENDHLKQLPIAKRSAKLERLLELLDEAVSGGHRVLVFSQFRTQLALIRECLDGRGVESLLLDGETRDRQGLVDRFQAADGPPVFLISLKAGGYGLNLTAADIVIHFDPWWNPAAETQATDRAHRIGQTRPVTVYRLLTRGTVEAKVVALQAKKRVVSSAIDEAGAGEAAGWTERELAELVEG